MTYIQGVCTSSVTRCKRDRIKHTLLAVTYFPVRSQSLMVELFELSS